MSQTTAATEISKTTKGTEVANIKQQGRKERKNTPFHLSISCSS